MPHDGLEDVGHNIFGVIVRHAGQHEPMQARFQGLPVSGGLRDAIKFHFALCATYLIGFAVRLRRIAAAPCLRVGRALSVRGVIKNMIPFPGKPVWLCDPEF